MEQEVLRRKTKKEGERLTPIGRFFGYRKISFWVVRYLVKTKITPNQISYVSIILRLTSASLIGTGRYSAIAAGVTLFALSIYLDHIDGDLARAKSMSSDFGRLLDVLQEIIMRITIPLSVTSAVFVVTQSRIALLLGGLAVIGVFITTTMVPLVNTPTLVTKQQTDVPMSKTGIRNNVLNRVTRLLKKRVAGEMTFGYLLHMPVSADVALILVVFGGFLSYFFGLWWLLIYIFIRSIYETLLILYLMVKLR